MIFDANGNLFGTATKGGSSNDGTVFELPNGSSTITAVASFNGTNGANPKVGLTIDPTGNMFGRTDVGGAGASGTIFEVVNGSGTITTLASFKGGTFSGGSFAPLTLDSHGNLFGTAEVGGRF